MKKKVSNVQKKFIKAYVNSLNPVQSAIEAGYSPKNAASCAQMLLDNQYIIDEINCVLYSQTKTLNISKAYIVKKLVDIIENSLDCYDVELVNENKSFIQHNDNAFDDGNSNKSLHNKSKYLKKQKDVAVALKALENLCKQLDLSSNSSKFEEKDDIDCDCSLPQINIINNLDENKL